MKRIYYGIGCTNVNLIRELNDFNLSFTPNSKESPKHFFHCDILDDFNYNQISGEASSAEVNLRRELLKEKFEAYKDEETLRKEMVLPVINKENT